LECERRQIELADSNKQNSQNRIDNVSIFILTYLSNSLKPNFNNRSNNSGGGDIATFLFKNKKLIDQNDDNTPIKHHSSSIDSNTICLNSPGYSVIQNKIVDKASSSIFKPLVTIKPQV
jgi:hypothetical protein